jgi:hypothetical protein
MPEGILRNLNKILMHNGGVVSIKFTATCCVKDDDNDNPIIQTREQKEAPQKQQTNQTYVYSTIILLTPIKNSTWW